MNRARLDRLRDLIQDDIGGRGLRTDPVANLVTALPDDFALACASLADHPQPSLAVVTGFLIPTANPPAGETDGPLGALFLARALVPLGIRVTLITDDFCIEALECSLAACGLRNDVPLITLPTHAQAATLTNEQYAAPIAGFTHLLAIERVGPSHTHARVEPEHRDRCHTMRGRDITDQMSPAHRLFEWANFPHATASNRPMTIGIGDGGNEIGMGKIPWEIIDRNIPGGGQVACRIDTDLLIVCGVSNWGAYALAAGVALLRGRPVDSSLFDPEAEHAILARMVGRGKLVDGVLAKSSVTVDGLPWERYAEVLVHAARL